MKSDPREVEIWLDDHKGVNGNLSGGGGGEGRWGGGGGTTGKKTVSAGRDVDLGGTSLCAFTHNIH